MVSIPWDLAEFTNDFSNLGKKIPTGTLSVPAKIELADGCLIWSSPRPSKEITPGTGLLNDFVRLWEAGPNGYLKYAKTWGVLYLDQDGRPCVPIGPVQRSEPLWIWRHFSRRACAVLNIASALSAGTSAPKTEWQALSAMVQYTGDFVANDLDRLAPHFFLGMIARQGFNSPGVIDKLSHDLKAAKTMLNIEMMNWLRLGRVGLTLVARDSGWAIETDLNQCLLSAVALELAMTVAGADSLFSCSSCKKPYVRERYKKATGTGQKSPKLGQANFCNNCGRDAALRQADQRRREKKAKAKQLYTSGKTVKQIAKEMEVKETTVNSFLRGLINV